jgi:hypothetical protein
MQWRFRPKHERPDEKPILLRAGGCVVASAVFMLPGDRCTHRLQQQEDWGDPSCSAVHSKSGESSDENNTLRDDRRLPRRFVLGDLPRPTVLSNA